MVSGLALTHLQASVTSKMSSFPSSYINILLFLLAFWTETCVCAAGFHPSLYEEKNLFLIYYYYVVWGGGCTWWFSGVPPGSAFGNHSWEPYGMSWDQTRINYMQDNTTPYLLLSLQPPQTLFFLKS